MKGYAKKFFLSALEACTPSMFIEKHLSIRNEVIRVHGKEYKISESPKIYIIAAGKASCSMAKILKETFNISSSNIICITPDLNPKEEYCISSSHPVPDERSIKAAELMLKFIAKIPADAFIFFALSGGASSLVCKPSHKIKIGHIRQVNDLLLKSGATIKEINTVRKHLSVIKGGELLKHFNPNATLIDLVISDVPHDDLEVIGGGLTTPDSSTFRDTYDILLRYDLWNKLPGPVRTHIQKGLKGEVSETLKPGEDPVKSHDSLIIGSAQKFAKEIASEARKEGFETWVADEPFNQPVAEVANLIYKKIKEHKQQKDKPVALIFYGESTVEVKGSGKGGRNQELALHGGLYIQGMHKVTWLSAGTDGIDGPTDAAGALVDGKTLTKAKNNGLNAAEFLMNNDSYHFHKKMGTLLKTGPTGNNVMDITLIILE